MDTLTEMEATVNILGEGLGEWSLRQVHRWCFHQIAERDRTSEQRVQDECGALVQSRETRPTVSERNEWRQRRLLLKVILQMRMGNIMTLDRCSRTS